jgi:hypothetical protein
MLIFGGNKTNKQNEKFNSRASKNRIKQSKHL